jgi:RimJ/RimL family protein N-acetyltransferase
MDYLLRELARADLPLINRWRQDREVQDLLVGVFRMVGPEVDEQWFDAYLGARDRSIRAAICETRSGAMVGMVYLLNIDWVARSTDLGICIGEKTAQGKGAGEFATAAMLDHAFTDMNLHRVALSVLADNERAIRLYRKIGFVEEGRSREAVFKHGKYMDLIDMALLRHEYRRAG